MNHDRKITLVFSLFAFNFIVIGNENEKTIMKLKKVANKNEEKT